MQQVISNENIAKINRIFDIHTGFIKCIKNEDIAGFLFCLVDLEVNPAGNNNEAIFIASGTENMEIFKTLLREPSVDPSARNNDPLQVAILRGRYEKVKELLKDKRVQADTTSKGQSPIMIAITLEKMKAVELMVESGKVQLNPSYVSYALALGNIQMANYLVKSGCDQNGKDGCSILIAAAQKTIIMMKWLLACEKVDPSAFENKPLKIAIKNGNIEMVKLITQDRRFKKEYSNEIMKKLEKYQNDEIFKIIVKAFDLNEREIRQYSVRLGNDIQKEKQQIDPLELNRGIRSGKSQPIEKLLEILEKKKEKSKKVVMTKKEMLETIEKKVIEEITRKEIYGYGLNDPLPNGFSNGENSSSDEEKEEFPMNLGLKKIILDQEEKESEETMKKVNEKLRESWKDIMYNLQETKESTMEEVE
jgi:hypothetical protein